MSGFVVTGKADVDEIEDDEKNFDDWIEDDEATQVKSLFSDSFFSSIDELIAHEKENFDFDFQAVVRDVCKDDMSFIKLVNYIRRSVKEANQSFQDIITLVNTKEFLGDDRNMIPILEEDPLLYLYADYFEDLAAESEDNELEAGSDDEKIDKSDGDNNLSFRTESEREDYVEKLYSSKT
jgi:hypothetical protein